MRIGEMSALTGLSASAIRYYERIGLAPPPRRGRRRVYETRDAFRLKALKAGRSYGLSIAELRALTKAGDGDDARRSGLALLTKQIDRELAALERRRKAVRAASRCGCVSFTSCDLLR